MMLDWCDLEHFSQTRTRTTHPYITITKHQLMTFSAAFIRKANDQITGNSHVTLSFSKKNHAIVFQFISDANYPGAVKITMRNTKGNRVSEKGVCASLAAQSFLKHYQINQIGKYEAQLAHIPEQGWLWAIYL